MTGIVLAGGKSSRMGFNKAFIEFGGKRLIEATVDRLRALFPEVLIIANDPPLYAYLGVKVISDLIPDSGSLGGIYTGLSAASYPTCFFVACDMPFLNADLIKLLVREAEGWDVVVPRVGGELQPLHAVYARSCLPLMKEAIDTGVLKITRFFPKAKVNIIEESILREVDPHLLGFVNVNTPPELEQAEAISRHPHSHRRSADG
ncbi:MAG: molybdenum cofactor guanylyltransferase [bacterium]|uniref:Probable molybdenum cofactor guanylyltransferase n=1 Tax=Candidatus Methylomirabilis tolerans TaxID=3123416 RepID=A0AAJ1ALK9_9BACT|nr:molybdenum cofactor guanylyltransferase [Candidatus Methylomirabilis sp.]